MTISEEIKEKSRGYFVEHHKQIFVEAAEWSNRVTLERIKKEVLSLRTEYEKEDYYGPDFFSALDMISSIIDDIELN